jgi:hypothetical protein
MYRDHEFDGAGTAIAPDVIGGWCDRAYVDEEFGWPAGA